MIIWTVFLLYILSYYRSSFTQNLRYSSYSKLKFEIPGKRQDEIAKIIQTIENESETFLTDLLNTVTSTFTGDKLGDPHMDAQIKLRLNALIG